VKEEKVRKMRVQDVFSRASLGTRFTRTQVTQRSSAFNANVEDAQMFQMVIPALQSSQQPFSVNA